VKVRRRTQEDRNLDTANQVRDALRKLRPARGVVLALVPSSKKANPPYPITLGMNNACYCACNGFKYRNTCRHMDRFRAEAKTQKLK
jgi:hypothetical protein